MDCETASWDVVVVGAGISGLSCAALLAHRGLNVLVLEREAEIGGQIEENFQGFPFYELDKIDMHIPKDYPVRKLTVWTPKTEGVELEFEEPILYLTKRGVAPDSFDSLLFKQAEKAGAKVKVGSEVANIVVGADGLFSGVQTKSGEVFKAKYIVASDGARSQMRKLAKVLQLSPKGIAYGLKMRGVRVVPLAVHFFFDLNVASRGYGYIIDYPDGQYATVALSARAKHLRENIRELFQAFLISIAPVIEGWQSVKPFSGVITCGDGTQEVVKNNLVFIGEAGGFQDPAFGFGMGPCIRSAKLCADTIIKAIEEDDMSYLRWYSEQAKKLLVRGEIRERWNFRKVLVEHLSNDDLSAVVSSLEGLERQIFHSLRQGKFTYLAMCVGWKALRKRPALMRLIPLVPFTFLPKHW